MENLLIQNDIFSESIVMYTTKNKPPSILILLTIRFPNAFAFVNFSVLAIYVTDFTL